MISNKLKSARLAKELTQSEVAKKLYVTRQTVSRWEQGKTLPNIY
ncbi:TPA: helix-turn-helix transcriptional regulator, partial [Staphylococcus aureus]|nr:helix-turn-helix transcriptional regulator [Staphylococcus aureus]